MKKVIIFFLASIFALSCKNPMKNPTISEQKAAMEKGIFYKVDDASSSLKWIDYHNNPINPRLGIIKRGSLFLKDGEIIGGIFFINMKPILTNEKVADFSMPTSGVIDSYTHLRNSDSFEVQKYPISTFTIVYVTKVNDLSGDRSLFNATHIINGDLKIKNKIVGVSFPVKITKDKSCIKLVSQFSINKDDLRVCNVGKKVLAIPQAFALELNIKAYEVD